MDLVRIEPATIADAEEISSVKQRVWPEEITDPRNIRAALTHFEHAVITARWNGNPVGFVDGFMTKSVAGLQRWEVDLLAVHPDYRGRRLGTRLVEASLAAGAEKGAQIARGLVRLDNAASQRVFAGCGFSLRPQELALYVSTGNDEPQEREPVEGCLIEVQTFSYQGLWLEENFTTFSLAAAGFACRLRKLDLAGALIASGDAAATEAAQSLGYERVGNYQWWVKDLV